MTSKARITSLFIFAATLLALPVRANLIGNALTATGFIDNPNAIVGAGVEFSDYNGMLLFDFGANTLTVTNPVNVTNGNTLVGWGGGVNPLIFTGFTDTITSMSVLSNSGFGGNIVTHFSFTANSITLDNFGTAGSFPSSKLVFSIGTVSNAVPDNGQTFALLGGTMLGLAALRRRFTT